MKNHAKLQDLDELAAVLDGLRAQGKTVVQCHGVFDLLHPGHIRHLEAARRRGDVLVVTVTKDQYVRKGPGRPVFAEQLRAEALAALEAVDYVCLLDSYTAVESIRRLRPDLYAKGRDYRDASADLTGMIVAETEAVHEVGGEVLFTDEISFSSSSLLNAHLDYLSVEQRAFVDALKRKTSAEDLVGRFAAARGLRVLVVGDAIVDEYVYCEPLGQSLKNTLVVHRRLREERFAGGALAVANQAVQFCDDVRLLTVTGGPADTDAFARARLHPNVDLIPLRRSDAPTVVKRRYVYENVERKIFEVCEIDDRDIPPAVEQTLLAALEAAARECDLVMLSDYGHGVITPRVAQAARETASFLAVNAQTNSANLGYNLITRKYASMSLACVDEPEARLAAQDKHADVESLTRELAVQLDAARLLVTDGPRGSIGYDRTGARCRAPALAARVVDRTGAGDAFYVCAALASAAGLDLDEVSFLANALAGLAVQVVGNREAVQSVDLFKFVSTLFK